MKDVSGRGPLVNSSKHQELFDIDSAVCADHKMFKGEERPTWSAMTKLHVTIIHSNNVSLPMLIHLLLLNNNNSNNHFRILLMYNPDTSIFDLNFLRNCHRI